MEKPPKLATPDTPGIAAGRLTAETYTGNFGDAHPPLSANQAQIEANRCHYCFNAPCIKACPTEINIPQFIQRIAQGNLRGAAQTIFESNILGGLCSRVCPTEDLCEKACVRTSNENKPVEISLLQRFATDTFFSHSGAPLFSRSKPTGRRIAIVGSGPAGLAAAHQLARLGHEVTIFEARHKLGGLNEFGLARYKTPDNFAQREIDWLLSIGGIEYRTGQTLGQNITLDVLTQTYDAVFLGLGLAGIPTLGITEPKISGLRAAVDFIADIRQAKDLANIPVGRNVIVIGGGMTAIDAAVQAKMLGAREVSMVYRRGVAAMSASVDEQNWARSKGVTIQHWATPKEILSTNGAVSGVRFCRTRSENGMLVDSDEYFTLEADMVLTAIGQSFVADPVRCIVDLEQGRLRTDHHGRTSHPKIWAGGDCCSGGLDLTVDAVAQGKRAAISIDAALHS